MPDVTPIPVEWVKQETLFFCGPAVAQMILTALKVPTPSVPPTWQEQVYAYIKVNTNKTRPRSAPDTVEAPKFTEQFCERCHASDPYTCWNTTPNVLKRYLNDNQSATVYSVAVRANEETATDALCDTLDKGFPAVALVYGWTHWVVVDGYQHGEPGSFHTSGRDLNGVYIRDPDAPSSVHFIPWSDWETQYLKKVPCGQYQGKFVVIRTS
jgi:hypothetical protein